MSDFFLKVILLLKVKRCFILGKYLFQKLMVPLGNWATLFLLELSVLEL